MRKEHMDIQSDQMTTEEKPESLPSDNPPSTYPPIMDPLRVKVITIQPSQPAIKKTSEIKSITFSILQGDEKDLQDIILDWYTNEDPDIIYSTTWVIGIAVYILFVYR